MVQTVTVGGREYVKGSVSWNETKGKFQVRVQNPSGEGLPKAMTDSNNPNYVPPSQRFKDIEIGETTARQVAQASNQNLPHLNAHPEWKVKVADPTRRRKDISEISPTRRKGETGFRIRSQAESERERQTTQMYGKDYGRLGAMQRSEVKRLSSPESQAQMTEIIRRQKISQDRERTELWNKMAKSGFYNRLPAQIKGQEPKAPTFITEGQYKLEQVKKPVTSEITPLVKQKQFERSKPGRAIQTFKDYNKFMRETPYNPIGINIGISPTPTKKQIMGVTKPLRESESTKKQMVAGAIDTIVSYPREHPYKTGATFVASAGARTVLAGLKLGGGFCINQSK